MQTLIYDVEANDLLPGLKNLWCIGICTDTDPVVQVYTDQPDGHPSIAEALARLSAADRLVAHNGIGYDMWAINKLYPGTVRFEQHWDTLAMSQLLFPERKTHNLAIWGAELGFPKGDFKEFSVFSPAMLPYMERDVEITYKLYHKFQAIFMQWFTDGCDYRRAIGLEHHVQFVLALQSQHGFRLDVPMAQNLEMELSQEMQDILVELQEVFPPKYHPEKADWDYKKRRWCNRVDPDYCPEYFTPKKDSKQHHYTAGAIFTKVKLQDFNPGSTQQVGQRLSQSMNWRPEEWTATGPSVKEETLKGLPYKEAVVICRYLRIKKMMGMLSSGANAWLKLEVDGYTHGYVKSCGARTHRMSHNSPNMAQVDKKDIRMRQVWLPDKGHVLVGCDASGLELRVMAHYLAEWDGGAYIEMATDGDAHTNNMNIVGVLDRDIIKTWFYALIYGAGDLVLGLSIIEDRLKAGLPLESTARAYGKQSRVKLEGGLTGYAELVDRCKRWDKTQKWLQLPDGRAARTNGGHSATNTLFQGTGSIIMKEALRIFHFVLAPKLGLVDDDLLPVGFHYCANVHDEVQFSCDPEVAELVGSTFRQAVIDAGESLGILCPMDGEYKIGANWAETH
jgi:DNA polymerase-1